MTQVAASLSPQIVQPAGGRTLQVAGHATRVILGGEQTGGAFALCEVNAPAGDAVPPHIHTREDETFIILEGEIDITVNGVVSRLGAGAVAFGPRGVPHAFANPGPAPARMLVMTVPAGIERFFAECSERLRNPPDRQVFAEIVQRYGILFA